jgi:hypothetical protein
MGVLYIINDNIIHVRFSNSSKKLKIKEGAVGVSSSWKWYYEINTSSQELQHNTKFCKVDPYELTIDYRLEFDFSKNCYDLKIDYKKKPIEYIDEVHITDNGYFRVKFCSEIYNEEVETMNCKNERFVDGVVGNYPPNNIN